MKRLALALVAVVALAGCNSDVGKNTDPRKGRVVTEDTSCLWGSCQYSWNVCVGPDWIVHIQGTKERTFKNAPECAS